ncbi:hypothetical protein J2Q08_13535 [Tenacibaculum finnmarkense genomovar finnmarkense]|uniref:hypothetical protein n=1 Tax=Tenacibaculum finnmarkense TaxID=2781243 RepID=UPI001E3A8B70|nr:hypothetical protein [Tenacibaculum finnmarkense]MCD8401402.1 hypothetical protein [Tenacibaculum finnmarkense genomovar ulcerans]MCM8863581.1 hypothetical protein [Tenacibaculum finnmarkense genomovar finnmarkense]
MKGFFRIAKTTSKKEDGIFPALLVYNALFGSDKLLLSIAYLIPQGVAKVIKKTLLKTKNKSARREKN